MRITSEIDIFQGIQIIITNGNSFLHPHKIVLIMLDLLKLIHLEHRMLLMLSAHYLKTQESDVKCIENVQVISKLEE